MKWITAIFTNPDVKKKILFTLGILLVFRIGVYISVPGVDVALIRKATTGADAGIFEMMNMLGGNALSNYSIFGLGVGPYITASIIIQLLAMDIVPFLTDLQQGGDAGRKKLAQITRYATIVLAFAQAIMLTLSLNSQSPIIDNPSAFGFILIALFLTAGAMFLLWLADQITVKGIGNGTSMIIFAGIVDKVPMSFVRITQAFTRNEVGGLSLLFSVLVIALFIALIYFTVFTQQAQRKIPVQYANNMSAAGSTFLPFKINVAGVIPVIFASAILMVPATVLSLFAQSDSAVVVFLRSLFDYTTIQGLILYVLLIFGFTYFYANLQVDAKRLTENLGRSGGYIIGVRPGEETFKFIKRTVNRLNFLGAASLSIIASIPILLPMFTSISKNDSYGLGGTGLIIIVGVAIDIVGKIDTARQEKKTRSFIK